jgi:hypothetical protein
MNPAAPVTRIFILSRYHRKNSWHISYRSGGGCLYEVAIVSCGQGHIRLHGTAAVALHGTMERAHLRETAGICDLVDRAQLTLVQAHDLELSLQEIRDIEIGIPDEHRPDLIADHHEVEAFRGVCKKEVHSSMVRVTVK